ncbi:hypothetical protein MLD38_008329 [Melastoma candidum]|uniref:Uncharacterized protein n=1 Tax=Melastoma candidum TaxID=119954 RepID=A0ACB9RUI0_9MYRT|nr:hypothetical protein MLD38_008329 [Melastoma candidum]
MSLRGFVPFSQLSSKSTSEELLGKELSLKFVEVDEEESRLVLNNRKAMADSQAQFGIGQISHDRITDIATVLQPGDSLKVMILSHDRESGRETNESDCHGVLAKRDIVVVSVSWSSDNDVVFSHGRVYFSQLEKENCMFQARRRTYLLGLLRLSRLRHILRRKEEPDNYYSFPYHIEVPKVLLFGLLGFTFSILAPLMLPFLLGYFLLAMLVYRNQESGIPLIILTLLFAEYCRQMFSPTFKNTSVEVLIDLDREDERCGRSEEIHQQLRSAYCQLTVSTHKFYESGYTTPNSRDSSQGSSIIISTPGTTTAVVGASWAVNCPIERNEPNTK